MFPNSSIKVKCPKCVSNLSVVVTVEYVKTEVNVLLDWSPTIAVEVQPGPEGEFICHSTYLICRLLARIAAPSVNLYGLTLLEKTEVDHWLAFCNRKYSVAEFKACLQKLNNCLSQVTWLVGNSLTIADICVWSFLYANKHWQALLTDNKAPVHILRWYRYLHSLDQFKVADNLFPQEDVSETMSTMSSRVDDVGKFVDLPGAVMGEVVVRFPPEASGFLHIGHAKAALLNSYYQRSFSGKLILRFDDTNPEKEKEDFEKVIEEDVAMLQIKPDVVTYTSDHFGTILDKCEYLLKNGLAFVDDTDAETMKVEREKREDSRNRSIPVAHNLAKWAEMRSGTDYGKSCCVRAKIDMKSDNGCMRDPTLYRCKAMAHPRTGRKFNVYPTYDFACPIVDSIECVTHALRTTEYHDRDEQYFWVLDTLGLRKPFIYEYSRLNMTNTVLSKRKLTWFVQQGIVSGWDDPRMPTVRGILRRGMTVEGLTQFIIAQGSSRSIVVMEWDKLWAFNKKVIDPLAPRYSAVEVENRVVINIENAMPGAVEVAKHPKNAALGTKMINVGPKLFVDYADAEAMKIGENVTFINWGNVLIKNIEKNSQGQIESVSAELNLDNKDYKKTLKVTWLAADTEGTLLTPCACVYYDHLISKPILGKDDDFKTYLNDCTEITVLMHGDPSMASLQKGDIIQIQRKGFFICDKPYDSSSLRYTSRESPLVLFSIPDGTKDLSIFPQAVRIQRNQKQSVKEVLNRKKGKAAEKSPMDEESGDFIMSEVSGEMERALAIEDLNFKIKMQGDRVRKLKDAKVNKKDLSADIELLLQLKKEYHSLCGKEWKPESEANVAKASKISENEKLKLTLNSDEVINLNNQICQQGDKIRKMKSDKASKEHITTEVNVLLGLKNNFKNLTMMDWKPDIIQSSGDADKKLHEKTPLSLSSDEVISLNDQICQQGDKIRKMKSDKASKELVTAEVNVLLNLKSNFKKLTAVEWKPDIIKSCADVGKKCNERPLSSFNSDEVISLNNQISQQGDKIRKMKSDKASKELVTAEVNILLNLKSNFKNLTTVEWTPNLIQSCGETDKACKEQSNAAKCSTDKTKLKEDKAVKQKQEVESESALKKVTRLGLEAKKEENLADWYSQVITKAEMIEYYDVSGCYILRPWAFSIWESITKFFDPAIKALGVSNCYFPMFVSPNALEKEKTHIADFAPEVAWVTKSGKSELEVPIAIRPTSETVMYPSYAKWIRSYRDLPLLLNQWCSVVRWEFKNPQPFIRTREFLWQEGHTAFATQKEAVDEVYKILDLYTEIYENLLAIPVVKGKKTEKEKFAGADFTTTVEAYVSANGRAIQGATSHHLGQNFSKMFEIIFEDPETSEKCFVYQNSWGLSTRSIGVMIMVHSDNVGLVLPPRVAMYQVVIIPCGITANLSDSDKNMLFEKCKEFESLLCKDGVRVKGDYRENYSPGWKYNHWELKGVPIRIELGPRDIKKNQYVAVRRDTGEKLVYEFAKGAKAIKDLLDTIHKNLYSKAKHDLDEHLAVSENWDDFCQKLDNKCIIQAPFCGEILCEDKIKKESARDADEVLEPGAPSMGAKSLCIPFKQPKDVTAEMKCINPSCMNKPKCFTLFGRSY